MTYKEAQEWIVSNKHLIGKVTEKGVVYRDLVIVPSDDLNREEFLRSYILSYYNKEAIIPYIGRDLQVWAIDTDLIRTKNVLFYVKLAE